MNIYERSRNSSAEHSGAQNVLEHLAGISIRVGEGGGGDSILLYSTFIFLSVFARSLINHTIGTALFSLFLEVKNKKTDKKLDKKQYTRIIKYHTGPV